MNIKFSDGTRYVANKGTDTFFLGFNNNYFLRESCYRCHYCGTGRVADFTIGDFWGVNPEELPEGQIDLGVSLMLCNTERARDMLDELRKELEIEAICPENAISHNRALASPQPRPQIRDTFFAEMERKGYDPVVKSKHKKRFFKLWVKGILRRILPRCVIVKIMKNPEG